MVVGFSKDPIRTCSTSPGDIISTETEKETKKKARWISPNNGLFIDVRQSRLAGRVPVWLPCDKSGLGAWVRFRLVNPAYINEFVRKTFLFHAKYRG